MPSGAALALLTLWSLCLAVPARAQTGPAAPAAPAAGDEEPFDYQDEFSLGEDEEIIADPIEPFNRLMFQFNDKLYFYVLKPVTRAYRVLPQGVRVSVSNFFSNLAAPIRVINSGLQLKLSDAGHELVRFTINTTVGIGGLFDPARNWLGISSQDEDFGQTLGRYGVGQGFYLVLPVLGSSSLRDGFGTLVDAYADPVIVGLDREETILAVKSWDTINYLSLDRDTYESIKRTAFDPYDFIKNAYAQRRKAKVER